MEVCGTGEGNETEQSDCENDVDREGSLLVKGSKNQGMEEK